MKKVKTLSILFTFSALIYLSLCFILGSYEISEGVSQNKLMKIKQGISKSELFEVIGKPFKEENNGNTLLYSNTCGPCFTDVELYFNFRNERLYYAAGEFHDLGFWWINHDGKPEVLQPKWFKEYIPHKYQRNM